MIPPLLQFEIRHVPENMILHQNTQRVIHHLLKRPAKQNHSDPIEQRATNPTSAQIAASSVQPSNGSRQRRKTNPLGLTVLIEPVGTSPSVDIVFVHGLRGTSKQTWSLDKELKLFWPEKWLPEEPALRTARISTFGYNSDYLSRGSGETTTIANFSRDLLSALKVTLKGGKDVLDFGKVPVIFVVHSMGGLVVKKAYILGTNDPNYVDIIQSTSAILFLSTPHRGSDLATQLDRVVNLLVPGGASKEYVAELKKNSPTLDDINDQFRNLASRIEIISFYETMPMDFGLYKQMILEKDSSVLGYSGELAIPLHTDHRGVAKFPRCDDPSYIKILGVLKGVVGRLSTWSFKHRNGDRSNTIQLVRALLAVTRAPDEDHEFFHHRITPGTCNWIVSEPVFTSWLDDPSSKPRVVWFHGSFGNGKSVLASHVVEYIRKTRNFPCQFFYFRYERPEDISLSSFLRVMAYQVALHIPEFERCLATMGREGTLLEKSDDFYIWRSLFLDILFQIRLVQPIYWVVDALEEYTSKSLLISEIIKAIPSNFPIRIMFVSRWTQSLRIEFEKLAEDVQVDTHHMKAADEDLATFVAEEIQDRDIPGDANLKKRIGVRILELADGNFMWASLVIKELHNCRTEASMKDVVEHLPQNLERLYQRMTENLSVNWKGGDEQLAKSVLTWVACSKYPPTLQEISGALEPHSLEFLNWRDAIGHACGNLIEIDGESRITIVHGTARDYLTTVQNHKLSICLVDGHRVILKRCLIALLSPKLRSREGQLDSSPFLQYAAVAWPYHLSSAGPDLDDGLLSLLGDFLVGPSVLNWICVLSYAAELKQLAVTSKALNAFLLENDIDGSKSSPPHQNEDIKKNIKLMAVELTRILGKFEENLLSCPEAIYTLIPPFCPSESLLRRQFEPGDLAAISVSGISNDRWDDSITKLTVERYFRALKISCVDQYFAISTSSPSGNIRVFNTVSSREVRKLSHGERVLALQFSNSGQMLATYGYRTTKIWEVATERVLYTFDNPRAVRILAMGFLAQEAILTCSDDGMVRKFSFHDPTQGLTVLKSILADSSDGGHFRAPNCAAFNSNSTLLAAAYPGCPLSVWDVSPSHLVNRHERTTSRIEDTYTPPVNVVEICWNPSSGHILGRCDDGSLFKWHPSNDNGIEILPLDATAVKCSPTGSFLVSSDDDGTLKIWNFKDFSLVYELSCPSTVSDLAISSDGTRVYDLRGSYCNIWEPDSLSRLVRSDERASETLSTLSSSATIPHISKSTAGMRETIEALAVGRLTSVYGTGHSNGVLKIFDSDGTLLLTEGDTSIAIDQMVWSDDENYLAIADLGTRIFVKSISKTRSQLLLLFKERIGKPIQQVLFNKLSNLLLVVTNDALVVWPIQNEPASTTKPLPNGQYRWINHPHKQELLMGFGPQDVRVLYWKGLEDHSHFSLNPLAPTLRSGASGQIPSEDIVTSITTASFATSSVEHILVSGNGSQILLQLSQASSRSTQRTDFLLVHTADINTEDCGPAKSITAHMLPEDLRDHIDRPLGFIQLDRPASFPERQSLDTSLIDEQLTFLSKTGWLCAFSLDQAGDATFKRHFFLPPDWLDTESLGLAQVTRGGMLLCPKDGEVGLVRNGFKKVWLSGT